jgi:HTH-type transcriptional regulator, quorum sensing regulator NprR
VITKLQLSLNKLKNCKKNIHFLNTKLPQLTKLQEYLLQKHEAIFFYKKKDIDKALNKLLKGYKTSKVVNIPDWEIADLDYCLGLVFSVSGQTHNSVSHTIKALEYFKNQFVYNRAVECYILLGICYKEMKQYEKSLEIYSLALKIIEDLGMEHFRGKIYHNMGSIYAFSDSTKAIESFKKSLEYKKTEQEKLITVLPIVEEYMKLEDWENANEWIESGFKLNSVTKDKFSYFYLTIYLQISLNQFITEEETLPVIQYFDSIKDYKNCYKVSLLLGDSLYKSGKYKSSANYYKKAHSYLKFM